MKKQNLLIDTDMGYDDIVAIMMLLISKRINIVGITTVSGVVNAKIAKDNLLKLFSFLRIDIPVVSGTASLLKNMFPIKDTKRAESLELINIPNISTTDVQNVISAEDYIYKRAQENELIIFAIGPLTNIANTIQKYKKGFTKRVKKIVLMGGGIYIGNVPPLYLAEYNILLDPKAASIVFQSKIPITMVGIDATSNVPVSEKFKKKIRLIKSSNKIVNIIKDIILNNKTDFKEFYDPLAASILLNFSLVKKTKNGSVSIQKDGKTVFDQKEGNTQVILDVDRKRFEEYLINLCYYKGNL